MAAVGSSVGLGNFWRFPYTAGENGGGAFILIYLVCVLCIGLPVLMGELSLGRKAGMSSVEGLQTLAQDAGKSNKWGVMGWLGLFASTFIVSFYMVISVWILDFVLQAFGGQFEGITPEKSGENFNNTISNEGTMIGLLFLFVLANAIVVGRGVKGGIEKVASILMPAFFIMLMGVVAFSMMTGDLSKSLSFLFSPDFSKVNFSTFLAALGQACFSLGIGSVLMMTYGSYLSSDTNIPRSSFVIAGADTFVAIIAGLAIFPIVFQAGLDPAGGPGLFFVSLPVAFGSIPGGNIIAMIFFALALFAAFTSSISLFEVSVSWFEERRGINRMGAALGMGFILFLVGVSYIYSTNYLDFIDFVTGNLLLPLGALLVAIFIGWVLPKTAMIDEIDNNSLHKIWYGLLRYFAPIFIGIILVFGFITGLQTTFGVQMPVFIEALIGPNS